MAGYSCAGELYYSVHTGNEDKRACTKFLSVWADGMQNTQAKSCRGSLSWKRLWERKNEVMKMKIKRQDFCIFLSEKARDWVAEEFEHFLELQICYKKFIDGDYGVYKSDVDSEVWIGEYGVGDTESILKMKIARSGDMVVCFDTEGDIFDEI